MFEELGNWGKENHKKWSNLVTCQNCAVILCPWLLPVCLQCSATALWARPKPLAPWDTWVLLTDWGDQSRCCDLPAWTPYTRQKSCLNDGGSTLINTTINGEIWSLGTSAFQRVIPGFQQFRSSLPAWFFSLLVSQMEQWKKQAEVFLQSNL